jgi:hypothetical protein
LCPFDDAVPRHMILGPESVMLIWSSRVENIRELSNSEKGGVRTYLEVAVGVLLLKDETHRLLDVDEEASGSRLGDLICVFVKRSRTGQSREEDRKRRT